MVQPFYRVNSALDARHQGAGLGLPFAKSVVELHGGILTIASEIGSGTTVTSACPYPEAPMRQRDPGLAAATSVVV